MKEMTRPQHEGILSSSSPTVAASKIVSLNEVTGVRAYVDFAGMSADGDIALIGWLLDPEWQVQGFSVVQEVQGGLLKRRNFAVESLVSGVKGVQLERVLRADVTQAMAGHGAKAGDKLGFVLVVPKLGAGTQIAVQLKDGRHAQLAFSALKSRADIRASLQRSWEHSGTQLASCLRKALGEDDPFVKAVGSSKDDNKSVEALHRFAACDHVFVLANRALVLHGWIAKSSEEIVKVELVADGKTRDITAQMVRYVRPDLYAAYPWSEDRALGFFCVLTGDVAKAAEVRLKITCHNGVRQQLESDVGEMTWSGLGTFVNAQVLLATPLLNLLSKTPALDENAGVLADRIAVLRRENFVARHPLLPAFIEHPATAIVAVDRAYPLGTAGLLIYGWHLMPQRKPRAVYLRNADGDTVNVSANFTPLLRADVAHNYRARFPQVDDWCGFVCLAPMPTRPGESRVLAYDFEELGEVWVKVPVLAEERSGERLVNELVSLLPPAQYRSTLLGIGAALKQTLIFQTCIEELEDEQIGRDPATSILTCENAMVLNGKALLLQGWIGLDSTTLKRVELVTAKGEIDITDRIGRTMRTDLAGRFPWANESPAGFIALLEDPALIGQSLRLRVIGLNGERQLSKLSPYGVDWSGIANLNKSRPEVEQTVLSQLSRTRTLEDDQKRLADRVTGLRRENFLFRHPHMPGFVENPATVTASLDRAYALGQAGVLVFGWNLFLKRKPVAVHLRSAEGAAIDVTATFTPLLRADVSQKYRSRYPQVDDWCGFVALMPMPTRPGEARALYFDFGELGEVMMKLPISAEEKSGERLVSELIGLLPPAQYRSTLLAIGDALGESLLFRASIEELEDEQVGRDPATSILACDQALIVNGKALLLHGWIGLDAKSLKRVELVTGRGEIDITDRIVRNMRTDLAGRFSWAAENPAGFIALLEDAALIGQSLRLRILGADGERQLLKLSPNGTDWAGLAGLIKSRPDFETPLLGLLAKTRTLEDDPKRLADRLDVLRRDSFLARHPQLPAYVEQPARIITAIDRAYCLGEAGVLIFGWKLSPKRQPVAVRLHNADGESIDITDRLRALIRPDVAQTFRARFANTDDNCGYVCFAPMPTNPGEARALCFDFGEQGEVWLKVPTEKRDIGGIDLIKEVLGMVPSPDRMRHRLYELFSSGFGDAVEAINRARPPFQRQVEVREFGEPVAAPGTSIIVPLYGRYDFLRFQLANFADDPDFANVDLIYVVDDPNILSGTLELAARYQPLFGLPFRVAWYGENRGFAGANNIGVSLARGENLVLLNSDVIPVQGGWLTTLTAALDTLPDAGMVGPLLLFGDNSIQHAGMYPRTDTMFPGFLLNTHKGMGTVWEGGEQPSEHPMLTAACVVLKTQDFRDLGGFDEGYVIGDFEDSDLCLALRKKGKGMWLVPEAKLWHLERQSQNLSSAVGQRQMVTLFNGWRYNEKIRAGILSDPVSVETKE